MNWPLYKHPLLNISNALYFNVSWLYMDRVYSYFLKYNCVSCKKALNIFIFIYHWTPHCDLQPISSSYSTTLPSGYKTRTTNTNFQTGVSPSRSQRSKSPTRSTSPGRRPVSPNLHTATSPRLHNRSLSPNSKQVSKAKVPYSQFRSSAI